jgi:uncharacterized protein (TIGR02246 family)
MKRSNLLISLLVCTLVASASALADESGLASCEDLILDYAWHWDHDNHEKFANLFTADAKFSAAGRVHKGRDEIREAQLERTGKLVTRTFFSNIRVTPAGTDTVDATSYFMVHSEVGEIASNVSIQTRGFRLIGEMNFECRRTSDGWRISSLLMTPVFSDENLED